MQRAFPNARIVALAGGEARRWGDFRRAVAATAADLRQGGCRRAVLTANDGYLFAVGLFALMEAGAEIVLPANMQPDPLAALSGSCDLRLGDGGIAIREDGPDMWTGELSLNARLDFFTSGSTGAPKRISRRFGELVREIGTLEAHWGIALGTAPVFATAPHHHIFGLTFRLLWPLLAGRPFARFSRDLWEDALAEMTEGAVLIASPAHLSRLGGLTGAHRLAGLFTAGAPLSLEAARETEALFGRLPDEIYGSTETGAIATRRQTGPNTPWTPLPGVEIAAAEDRRLRLRARHVDPGDWVEMQDRVETTSQGFHLLGRLDRTAKIAGKRIDLDAVESAVKSLPFIDDAAVLTLDDADTVLAAVAVLTNEGGQELQRIGPFRLSRRLRADLAASQESAGRPRRWRFVEALLRSGLGKVSHADLTALFAAPASPVISAIRVQGHEAELDLEIPADLRWFDGHFPETPVLPGVVQLDWVLAQGRDLFGLTQRAARDFQVKFKSVIGPGDRLTLRLTHAPDARRLKFAYLRDGTICSTGSIVLETS